MSDDRNHCSSCHKTWTEKYLQGLVGRTIVRVGVTTDEDPIGDGYPYFDLDDGKRVVVLRDAEGNGPGFLDGLEFPK